MRTISKNEAARLVMSIRPVVASWTPTINERWSGKVDYDFSTDFQLVAVCDFLEEDPYPTYSTKVEYENGILRIRIPHDTTGLWEGGGGEIVMDIIECRVV